MADIWALLDDRAGNTSQTLGIAGRLDGEVEIVEVRYNALAKLPNFLRKDSLLGIPAGYKRGFTPPWPDIVVCAGRRLAPVAQYIKKQNPQVKLVQIMHPNMDLSKFTAIILPEHDRKTSKYADNIIYSMGAPHYLTAEKLLEAKQHWQSSFSPLPKPWVGVLIGGDTAKGKFTAQHANSLMESAQKIAGNGSLLISTSRRTSAQALAAIRANINPQKDFIYSYGDGGENPYSGIIASADTLIVTGDSVSMVSESCFSAKPVYVFMPHSALAMKHRKFLNSLYDAGYAKAISLYDANWQGGGRLDEAGRIAQLLKETYLKSRN